MTSTLAPERIHQRHWSGQGVTVAEVVTQLYQLQSEFLVADARHEGGPGHPHPRNAVLNIVAISSGGEAVGLTAATTEAMSSHHPGRVILLCHQHPDQPGDMRAEIDCHAHDLLEGPLVQHERVTLWVPDEAAHHLVSLIEPLLISDVATHVWWMDNPPIQEGWFREGAAAADALILDSATFGRPYDEMLSMAGLSQELAGRGLTDFQWLRLRHWRELLAQFFNPAHRRPLLAGINGLGIDYRASGRGNRGGAALLVGWLQSRLGWSLKRAAGGSGGIVTAYLESARSHPIEVALRPVELAGLQEGEILAVRVHASAQGKTLSLTAERDLARPEHVVSRMELGADTLTQLRVVDVESQGDLLLRALVSRGRDEIYRTSLAAGADLLTALR